MRILVVTMTTVFLCLVLSGPAFSQVGNAQLGGVVTDATGALVPGVSITVTNQDTGVTSSTLTNEAGAYNFASLQPGAAYKASAALSGFRTTTFTNLQLGTGSSARQNFQLQVANAQTAIEVTADRLGALTESSASVGDVLPQDRIQNLPLVGNNVLSLLNILPGLRLSPLGNQGDTVGGLGLGTVNVTRDGMTTNDVRFSAEGDLALGTPIPNFGGFGVMTPVTMSPDLVGEIRLILSPVDAELGRGNSQVQVQTRSGTNKFSGSAVWNVQNTALNANTWNNNRNTVNGVWTPTHPDWRNTHEYTLSYGGPIAKNKTFFYVLWDQNISKLRSTQNNRVLTQEARNGIFRFWEGWVADSADPTNNPTTYPTAAANPSIASVDSFGKPLRPLLWPDGTPYTGRLVCFSIFGTVKRDGTPFGANDCPSGADSRGNGYTGLAMPPSGSAAVWDPKRPSTFNSSGYFAKIMDKMPLPNNFFDDTGDGLNSAVYRYLLTRNTGDPVFYNETLVGNDPYSNRKQINIKIDQNFRNHRISGGWTYQMDNNTVLRGEWPDGLAGLSYRRPHIFTLNVASTLSPTLLNEARFGLNLNKGGQIPPWLSDDSKVRSEAQKYLGTGGARDGVNYPILVRPYTGAFAFGENVSGLQFDNAIMQQNLNGATITPNFLNDPLYDFADTISWTRGKHAFKFGADLRLPRSRGYAFQPYPAAVYGNLVGSTASPFADAINGTPTLGAVTGNSGAIFRQDSRNLATNLAYLLTDSIGAINTPYWIENQADKDKGAAGWQDITTRNQRYRETVSTDYAFFAKDDYKLSKTLTLNLGLRYEYYSPPYLRSGLTSTVVGLADGLFGAGRSASAGGKLFGSWLQPGNLYLAGYGTNPTGGALRCEAGVPLPGGGGSSTCDPNFMTNIQFIGPESPNTDATVLPRDRNNFGPAIGFAWQVPWFGEGKTTVRGGYQVTYSRINISEATLASALGANRNETLTATDADVLAITSGASGRAITAADLPTLVPRKPSVAPGQTVPVYARSAAVTAYDPNLATPYTQNLTLSVTRSVRRNMIVDLRYVGTLARKQTGSIDLNTNTIMYNPELFDALERTRRGENVELFDQMLAGLRLNGVPATVPLVNGTTSRGSDQLRLSTTGGGASIAANLANGNFVAVANALVTGTPTAGQQPAPAGLSPGPSQVILRNGCDRLANGQTSVPTRCFPENYLIANPQLSSATYTGNLGLSDYHALQAQFSLRPTHGMSVQSTYSWAKSLQLAGPFTDPANRRLDRVRGREGPHTLRVNGTVELPIGPNKLLFANTSGLVGRLLERWQTSFILNLASGSPADILGASTTRYGNARYVVASPLWQIPQGHVEWNGPNHDSGTFYGTDKYLTIRDPQCDNTSLVAASLAASCTLNALAMTVPDGTPGSFLVPTGTLAGRSAVYALVSAKPGQLGTLGARTLDYWGQFGLDANAQKTIRLTESNQLTIRVDATNVLNHPQPAIPNFSVGATALGAITGATAKTGSRTFQGSLRVTF